MEAAQHCPFEIWKRDLTVLVELLDQDGGYDPNQDLAANTLHASLVGDARLVISGELVGENALVVAQALNLKADELARRYRHDHNQTDDVDMPARSTLLALALAELCRAGLATDLATTRAPHPDVTLVIRTEGTPTELDQGDEPDSATRTPTAMPRPAGLVRSRRRSARVVHRRRGSAHHPRALPAPAVRRRRHRAHRRLPRRAVGPGPDRAAGHPGPAPGPGHTRRRLRVPRL